MTRSGQKIIENKLIEVEKDICMNAGLLIAQGEIIIDDSRDFVNRISKEWAVEFFNQKLQPNNGNPSEKYLEDIDEFACQKLIETYNQKEG